jgi:hypothetical protein
MDDQFQPIAIDQATGLRAGPETPLARQVERVYWLLPAAYHDWITAQGVPLPPPIAQDALPSEGEPAPAQPASGPLILTTPTSNTAYQIHPGVPLDRQRVEIAGHVVDGRPWAELRLMHNGEILASASQATRLHAWWSFTPGNHQFWIEGHATPAGELVRTPAALVIIEAGATATAIMTSD